VTPRLRILILERDNYTCQYCGTQAPYVKLHVDHIIPRARGGSDATSNLITACQLCNIGKGVMRIRPPVRRLTEDQVWTLLALEVAHEVAFYNWMEQLSIDDVLIQAEPDYDPPEEEEEYADA